MTHTHDEPLRFADGETVVEELLLFSTDSNGTATEVTHKGIYFGGGVSSLYENSTVTKPVPVMVEGTYKVYNRATGKYEEVTITADDVREYAANTPRDVAMNYEHKKGQDPIGWLRLRDTAVCKPLKTSQGEKLALFASMELFPEAADKVKRGVYRDGSIELRPHVKEIIGHALTDFPIMRHTQFYSDDVQESTVQTTQTVQDEPVIEAAAPLIETPVEAPAMAGIPNQTEEFGEMDFTEQLAKYGLKIEDLQHLPALIASTEAEKAKAALTNARNDVAKFSADEEGNSYLTGPALEAAAQLLVFGNTHADTEIHFGAGDDAKTTTPAGLLETLLKSIRAVQVFGETGGPSAEDIIPDVPSPAEEKVDADRVSALRSRIKANISKPEQ